MSANEITVGNATAANEIVTTNGEIIEVKKSDKSSDHESHRSWALASPRNEKQVYEEAIAELKIIPGYAAKCFYSIPYRKGENETVYVEGPSVKAAMALARRWGNNANAARVADEDENRILVEGIFLDYQTNSRTLRTVSVSKTVWSKFSKSMVNLGADRLNLAIQSGLSKAVRNAILASLPVWLTEAYYQEAKKLALAGSQVGKPKTLSEKEIYQRIEELVKSFTSLGGDQKLVNQTVANLGKTLKPPEILSRLVGIYNAIQDGQTSLEEAFGKPEQDKTIVGAIPKAEDIFNKKIGTREVK